MLLLFVLLLTLCHVMPLKANQSAASEGRSYPSVELDSDGRVLVDRKYLNPEGWGDTEADVVCRQLGRQMGLARSVPLTRVASLNMYTVKCNGTEVHISDCNIVFPSTYNRDNLVAAVMCLDRDERIEVSLGSTDDNYDSGWVLVSNKRVFHEGLLCSNKTGYEARYETEASAMCRSLGYQSGQPATFEADLQSYEDRGSRFYLADFKCFGFESDFDTCLRSALIPINASECAVPVGVDCFDVRLSPNPSENIGNLVFLDGNKQSKLCAHLDDWNVNKSCRELGYPLGGKLIPFNPFTANSRETDTAYDRLECQKYAEKISQCKPTTGPKTFSEACGHARNAVSIHCFTDDGTVDGQDWDLIVFNGGFAVAKFGHYGYLRVDGVDDSVASLVCRSQGKAMGILKPGNAFDSYTPVWHYNISCDDTDTDLKACSHSVLTYYNPGPERVAEVMCFDNEDEVAIPSLVKVNDKMSYVQVSYNGTKGILCAWRWGDQDADVVCRQLGFKVGWAYSYPRFTVKEQFQFFADLDCQDDYSMLDMCRTSPWEITEITEAYSCGYYMVPAQVSCSNSEFGKYS